MNINRVLLTVTLAGAIGILGCTSPLKSEDPATRARAVAELSTDKELFFVAMNIGVYIGQQNGSYPNVFFTQEQYPDDVRVAAVERLKNMDYLLMCASWNDGDVYVDPGERRLEYCGANYYFQGKEDLRIPVLPGNVVKTAAIKRLSDFATFKEASKSLNTKAKGRLLPKPSSTMQRGSSSDGNAFIDHNGHIRPGNPLDNALRTALEKLKQPDVAAEFLYNAAEGGQGIASESFGYAMEQLEGVSSKVVYAILQKIFKEYRNMYTKNEWLPILIRYIDYPEAEQLLTAHDDNGGLFVEKADQRVMLLKKLPDDKMIELVLSDINGYNLRDWNNGNLNMLEEGVEVMYSINNTESVIKIVTAVLTKIGVLRTKCSSGFMYSWGDKDRAMVNAITMKIRAKLTDDMMEGIVTKDRSTWEIISVLFKDRARVSRLAAKFMDEARNSRKENDIKVAFRRYGDAITDDVLIRLSVEELVIRRAAFDKIKDAKNKEAALVAITERLNNELKVAAEKQGSLSQFISEVGNGEDLIAWLKGKRGQTDLQNKATFDKMKGKWIIVKGEVKNIGETTFGHKAYVSLRVGKVGMFEYIDIQFNVPDSLKGTIKTWMKGENHVMRGILMGKGDIQDDAVCENSEIIPDEKYNEMITVKGEMDCIKWQIRQIDENHAPPESVNPSKFGAMVKSAAEFLKSGVDDVKSSGDDLKKAAEMLNGLFN